MHPVLREEARHHKVRQPAEGKDVGAGHRSGPLVVHGRVTLRGHPLLGPTQGLCPLRQHTRQTEVEKLRAGPEAEHLHDDVRRLYVPVHDGGPEAVEVVQGARGIHHKLGSLGLLRGSGKLLLHIHVQTVPVNDLVEQCQVAARGVDACSVEQRHVCVPNVSVNPQLIRERTEPMEVVGPGRASRQLRGHGRAPQPAQQHYAEGPGAEHPARHQLDFRRAHQPMLLAANLCHVP
mmetsp:Transcript_91541/g.296330  ORF Transcript_91541/g.296330 Transcript_91541/m.296330 type:complete len:234 (-) Transcript_91541:1385-2086(-)